MKKFFSLIKPLHKKFLIFGIINSIFGYSIGIIIYFLLFEKFGIIIVGILSNIIAISFSFINIKLFVFQIFNTNWIKEYFKSFIVYGLQAIINISVLWLCIIVFNFNIYFSQAIAVFFTVIFSYRAHKKFTFNI